MRADGGLNSGCHDCKNAKSYNHNKEHPECRIGISKRAYEKRLNIASAQYDEWLKKSSLPFRPMTEHEWLKTCSYFNGCAICGNEHIETRQFFIQFTEGGKYTVWNIIPMCSICAKHRFMAANPFIQLKYGAFVKLGINEERREKLLVHLMAMVEKEMENGS